MSYIHFDKTQLINLEFSLEREMLRTNRAGSYSSSTIIFTNTRKYHGLLVVRQPLIDDNNHVLLSTLDETLIENDYEFHLSMRMYPGGVYDPKGHKYLRSFDSEPNPKIVYRVGNIVFSKEYIYADKEDRIMIRYTLIDSQQDVTLRIKPFLAYRNVHSLVKANVDVNKKYTEIKNGAQWQMYRGYEKVSLQFSKSVNYTHVPDWYYNIQYIREMERGYSDTEDLFVPGYFEVEMKKGESVVISAGTREYNPATLKRRFESEVKKRIPREDYESCLLNAASEFFVQIENKTEIIAGYPWFGRWGRDTFIALPGLALTVNDTKKFKSVINTMLGELKEGLFPNLGHGKNVAYNSVDASLWFFWALQQYVLMIGKKEQVWKDYGKSMQNILNKFAKGTLFNISMHTNGLLWQGEKGIALTWMDAVVNGKPVTGRHGYAVEVNALWYNAIAFALELAEAAGDKRFVNKWEKWPEIIRNSFKNTFWDDEDGYLADHVNEEGTNKDVRPNMIFAVSLPHSPVGPYIQASVLEKVKQELLTSRGLRSLSPKNHQYKGNYTGNQDQRDLAYHQGTAWPWLLGAYADAHLKLHGKNEKEHIQSLYEGFEEVMSEAGIGTISEIYDGDPPHTARGALSQAWNVSELLRIKWMLDKL
ncbi:MAG: amylo-alpha-1,6-glucosidase [Chlorobi bacterium]|nr:amylo-alpha-1,6-glucosidase [Chlorobiota bacterium]